MKDIELRLIAELMKNSRRSDRELAKVLGSSQPTITRLRTKLEKEGYIKEYTAIPDFAKLDFEILAITFLGHGTVNVEELEKATKIAIETLQKTYKECIYVETGIGLGYQATVISLHRSFSDYDGFMNRIKKAAQERYSFMDISKYQSFLINLKSERHFKPLTFSTLADHMLMPKEKPQKI